MPAASVIPNKKENASNARPSLLFKCVAFMCEPPFQEVVQLSCRGKGAHMTGFCRLFAFFKLIYFI